MTSRTRTTPWTALVLFSTFTAAPLLASGAGSGERSGSSPGDGAAATAYADKAIPKFQADLLDLAFQAATAMPVKPHIKTRSRLQGTVVEAALELDQPQRAVAYVEKIDDWRRGLGYAECASYGAQHGQTAEVEHDLELARKIAQDHMSDEDSQDWHLERTRAIIAKTRFQLGQTQEANRIREELSASESGPVNAIRATHGDAAALEEEFKAVDAARAAALFDQLKSALETCTRFYDRFYDDPEVRERIEDKIKASWDKMPPMIRIDLMRSLIGYGLDRKDSKTALRLVNETKAILEGSGWLPEDEVRLTANLAELRFRAGDTEKARSEVDHARILFDAGRTKIVNIWRAAPLRAVAEAYWTMGDRETALKTYKRVVEEGVGNPNSRPRAEDLVATCCSMALHGVEPDEALRTRLAEVCSGLREPW